MLKGDLSTEVPTTSVRVRSIPRKVHAQMEQVLFGQDVSSNRACARYVSMLPTKGLEVVVAMESKTLSHSLNVKRRMEVCGGEGKKKFFFQHFILFH